MVILYSSIDVLDDLAVVSHFYRGGVDHLLEASHEILVALKSLLLCVDIDLEFFVSVFQSCLVVAAFVLTGIRSWRLERLIFDGVVLLLLCRLKVLLFVELLL